MATVATVAAASAAETAAAEAAAPATVVVAAKVEAALLEPEVEAPAVMAAAHTPAVEAEVAPKPVAAEAMAVVQERVTAAGEAAGTAAAAVAGDIFGVPGAVVGGAVEVIDETAFNRRFLAFRQYLELRIAAAGKEAKRTWKLPLRRPPLLVDDVLSHFRQACLRATARVCARLCTLAWVLRVHASACMR